MSRFNYPEPSQKLQKKYKPEYLVPLRGLTAPTTDFTQLVLMGLSTEDELHGSSLAVVRSLKRSRLSDPRELIAHALERLELPSAHDRRLILDSPTLRISETGIFYSHLGVLKEDVKHQADTARIFNFPLDFSYRGTFTREDGQKVEFIRSNRVDVISTDELGFLGRHSRGFRRYRWDKVISAEAIPGDAMNLRPELVLSIQVGGLLRNKARVRVSELWRNWTLWPAKAFRSLLTDYSVLRLNHEDKSRNLRLHRVP